MRFDARAHSYDAHAAPQRDFAARVATFARVRPGEPILELGAGTGALTRHLVRLGTAGVRAIDVSPRMVMLGKAAVPAARWSVADAFAPLEPSPGLQISSGLLQWAPNPRTVLANWAAALAPGGRMVHGFPVEPCLREWRDLVPENPLTWRDEAGWLAVFAGAGLRVLRGKTWIETRRFPSALELVRVLHGSGVTGRPRIGAGELRRAIRAYDTAHATPGGVLATWGWMAIEAVPVR